MRHGLYDPRMVDEKVHKPKAVPLGPHVILDAERCILCSRCRAFLRRGDGTGDARHLQPGAITRRSGSFPGKTLENKYSGQRHTTICPVGALTDREFRFQVRVWYLDTARSVSQRVRAGLQHRGNHSRRRLHHNQGRRIARIKPRHNPDVNRWWNLRRGPLRLPLDRRRQPSPPRRSGARGGKDVPLRLGRGGGRPGGRAPAPDRREETAVVVDPAEA